MDVQSQQSKDPEVQSQVTNQKCPQWTANIEVTYSETKNWSSPCLIQIPQQQSFTIKPLHAKYVLKLPYQCIISMGKDGSNLIFFIRCRGQPKEEYYDDSEEEEQFCEEVILLNKLKKQDEKKEEGENEQQKLIQLELSGNFTAKVSQIQSNLIKEQETTLKANAHQILLKEILGKMEEIESKQANQPVSNLFMFQQGEQEFEYEDELMEEDQNDMKE